MTMLADMSEHARSDLDGEDQAEELAQLEAFGRDFLSSFSVPQEETQESASVANTKALRKEQKKRKRQEQRSVQDAAMPEAAPPADMDQLFSMNSSTTDASSTGAKRRKHPAVQTVVFQGEEEERDDKAMKKGWKAFMSSKIGNISKEDDDSKTADKRGAADEEEQELKANDRLLSDLLSTTLFAPGSGNSKGKQNLSSSDTIARILELSSSDTQRKGQSPGRGWGETELKRQQLAKAPAAIRQGMRKAAGERRDKEREKAKELGTWHPSLKQAYSSQATATERGIKKDSSKRQRGMGVGIGKFQGGILTLSKHDISKVNCPSKHSSSQRSKSKPRKK